MPKVWDIFEHPVKRVSDFKALVHEYRLRQERNIKNNVSASYTLNIQRRSAFSFLPSPVYDCTVEDTSASPPVTLGTQRRPVTTNLADLSPSSVEITLTAPICVGAPRCSQIWKAVTSDGSTVAVKIFQACFGSEPEWYDSDVDFIPEEKMAHREAWAYSRLKDIQGLIIPHSYGFFDIKVPSGDVVCAHVMEYIEGTSAERFAIFMRHQEKYDSVRDKLMTRSIEVLFYIHQRGVLHQDFTSPNIICPENTPEECVVIDFGFAMSSSDPVAIEDDMEGKDTSMIFPLFVNIHSEFGAYTWLENKAAEMRGNRPWIKFLLVTQGRGKLEECYPITEHDYASARLFDEQRDEYEAALKSKGTEFYYYPKLNITREANYYYTSDMPYFESDDEQSDALEPTIEKQDLGHFVEREDDYLKDLYAEDDGSG